MSGVYGNLLQNFTELYREIPVWTKEDKSDERTIVGVFLPTAGDVLTRWKFGNRGSAIDYKDHDVLYVDETELPNIHIGDFIYDPDDKDVHRIVGEVDYSHAGGYKVFTTERVTSVQKEPLTVKEAYFA